MYGSDKYAKGREGKNGSNVIVLADFSVFSGQKSLSNARLF